MIRYAKAYLYKRLSTLTKTNVWVLSTKKLTSVKFGGVALEGASSSTWKPGQQNVGTTDISTVWLNIEEGSEKESIINDMVEQNGGSMDFVLAVDKASGQTQSVLTLQEFEDLEDTDTDSVPESIQAS